MKPLEVDPDILFFSFRYALGRSSYAPSSVADTIKYNIKQLTTSDIKAYIREIQECEHYGHEIDRALWLELESFLAYELKNRELRPDLEPR